MGGMSYAEIDDLLPHHRKVRACPIGTAFAAFGLYVASVTFAQRELTDGVVLRSDLPAMIPGHPVPDRLPGLLTRVRLWDELPDGSGWRVHDYLEHNDSAEVRRLKRRKDRDRKRSGRAGTVPTDSTRNPSGVRGDSGSLSPPLHSPPLHSSPKAESGRTGAGSEPARGGASDLPFQNGVTGSEPELSRAQEDQEQDRECRVCFHAWR